MRIACMMFALTPALTSTAWAEDAYDIGYKQGYVDAAATCKPLFVGTSASRPIELEGTTFKTIVAPQVGTNLNIANDSAVAIVPPAAIEDFKLKLGADFLKDKNILLNDQIAK